METSATAKSASLRVSFGLRSYRFRIAFGFQSERLCLLFFFPSYQRAKATTTTTLSKAKKKSCILKHFQQHFRALYKLFSFFCFHFAAFLILSATRHYRFSSGMEDVGTLRKNFSFFVFAFLCQYPFASYGKVNFLDNVLAFAIVFVLLQSRILTLCTHI